MASLINKSIQKQMCFSQKIIFHIPNNHYDSKRKTRMASRVLLLSDKKVGGVFLPFMWYHKMLSITIDF
jgi:hypothetical protein